MFNYQFNRASEKILQVFKAQPLGTRVLVEVSSPTQRKKAIELFNERVLRFGYLPVEIKLTSKKPLDRQLEEVCNRNPDHKLVFQFTDTEALFSEFPSEKDAAAFLERSVAIFHIQRFPFVFWVSRFVYDALYQDGPALLKACWEHIRFEDQFNLPVAVPHQLHPPTPEKVRTHTIAILENQLTEQKLSVVGGYQYINVLQTLARNYFDHLQYEKAFECYEQCIRSGQTNIYTVAEYRNQMALIYLYWNRYDKALDMVSESLRIRKELDDKKGLAISFLTIGVIQTALGRFNRSLESFKQSIQNSREIEEGEMEAMAVLNTGVVYHQTGNTGAAYESFKRSLDLFKKMQFQQGISLTLAHIAFFQAETGKFGDALKYYLLSRSLAEKNNLVPLVDGIDRHLEILKEKLGQDQFRQLGDSIRKSIAHREKEDQKMTSL